MRGDGIAIAALLLIGGLLLQAVGAPVITWCFAAVASWFEQIPDVAPNIAKLLSSYAWPFAIVLIFLIFRTEFSRLIGSIKRLSWGDKTIDLSEQLDRVEAQVSQDGAVGEAVQRPLPDARFQSLLEISPAAAILDAWAEIDLRLKSLADSVGYSDSRRATIRRVIDFLAEAGHIDRATRGILIDLSIIRNRAAHIHDVTAADAYRFHDFALSVMNRIPAPNQG